MNHITVHVRVTVIEHSECLRVYECHSTWYRVGGAFPFLFSSSVSCIFVRDYVMGSTLIASAFCCVCACVCVQ